MYSNEVSTITWGIIERIQSSGGENRSVPSLGLCRLGIMQYISLCKAQRDTIKACFYDVRRASQSQKHHECLLISATYFIERTIFILHLEIQTVEQLALSMSLYLDLGINESEHMLPKVGLKAGRERDWFKMAEQKDMRSLPLAKSPGSQLTAEQSSTGRHWNSPKKIPHIQRQRRSHNEMVGGA